MLQVADSIVKMTSRVPHLHTPRDELRVKLVKGEVEELGKAEALEVGKWLQNATLSRLKLFDEVKTAIAEKQLHKLDQYQRTILRRVIAAHYTGTDAMLALKMLNDLLTAGALGDADGLYYSISKNNTVPGLVDLASHQSPAFIARLLREMDNTTDGVDIAYSTNKLNLAFQDYFSQSLYHLHNLELSPSLSVQEKWKEMKEGIILFYSYGCRPRFGWIVDIDGILAEHEKKDAKTSDRLQEVKLAMDVVRCILDHDSASESNLFSKEQSRLQDFVERKRYDLANVLIEYGYTCATDCVDESDHADKSNQVGFESLRKNPELATGFSKLTERRHSYFVQLRSVTPSDLGGGAFASLFGVSALLSIIVDCI